MPRKKFEEIPYDPIAADLAREVGAMGRVGELPAASPVVELRPERPQSVGTAALKMEHPHLARPTAKPKMPEPSITKRFIVSRNEDADLTTFLNRLQARVGTKVTLSALVRAGLSLAMQAEEQIIGEVGDRFPLVLPSTQDSIKQAEYEDHWRTVLAGAFRKMPRQGRG